MRNVAGNEFVETWTHRDPQQGPGPVTWVYSHELPRSPAYTYVGQEFLHYLLYRAGYQMTATSQEDQ